MVTCEGCDPAVIKNFPHIAEPVHHQQKYPDCPGHPTEEGCHGYYAGCNCTKCLTEDLNQSSVWD